MTTLFTPDPELDLVLDRVVDVPRALVWEAWTRPEHLKVWFAPRPWSIADVEIDLRPGGRCHTVMRSPDGTLYPNTGCYLEVVPQERLVFTDALGPGFRPTAEPFMTAMVQLKDEGGGTRYTATAIHRDAETRKRHEDMGFHAGWGQVLDQLVEHMRSR